MFPSHRCLVGVLLTSLSLAPSAGAQSPGGASCDDFLLPQREVGGKKVGPASCLMQETPLTLDGRTFARLDIGLDGTVDGYHHEDRRLQGIPDQRARPRLPADRGRPGPRLLRRRQLRARQGRGDDGRLSRATASAWNGKMWVTVHGRGASFKEGQLKAWNKNLDPADPLKDLNKYDKLMLSKGYALVKTRRTSSEGLGEIIATLEDGTTVDYAAFNDSAHYIMDFTEVAEKALAAAARARRRGAPTSTATRRARGSAAASTTRRA